MTKGWLYWLLNAAGLIFPLSIYLSGLSRFRYTLIKKFVSGIPIAATLMCRSDSLTASSIIPLFQNIC